MGRTALETLADAAPTLSVGMVTADLLSLGSEIALLEQNGVRVVHFDVMDGVFCPMMTIGPPIVAAVVTPLLKDVHLMIDDPLEKVDAFVAAGADIVTVHAEATPRVDRVLQRLGAMANANDPDRGIVRGVALVPDTPVHALEPLLPDLELVVLLAVRPGLRGQVFDPAAGERLSAVRELIAAAGRDVLVCIDGGITRANVADVARMGPDLIVTGSAVFDSVAPAENARAMLAAVASARA